MINQSSFKNGSYISFFGPVEMEFHGDYDDTKIIDILCSVFMVICMIVSLVGNFCTCAVIIRDKTMRTPTNCYLFNLAVTDLMTALFIPIEIYLLLEPDFYPFGEIGCRLNLIVWDCLSNCSALTISAFTVERYIVVSKPFLRQKLALKSRVYKIIAIIWIVSIVFCIPNIFYIDLLESKKYVYCYFFLSDVLTIVLICDIIVFFVMPMTIITVLYVLIAIKLKSTASKLRSSPVTGNQGRDKAVKMLAAVAALFFFCWCPYCLMRIMMTGPVHHQFEDYYVIWRILNYLCAVNVYVSTAVNPIVYSLMSNKFRQAFKDFLKRRKVRRSADTVFSTPTFRNTQNLETFSRIRPDLIMDFC